MGLAQVIYIYNNNDTTEYKKHPQLTLLVEPNPIDTPLLPDGQPSMLTELMFDYSGSGAGNTGKTFYYYYCYLIMIIIKTPDEESKHPPMTQFVEPNPLDKPLLPDGQFLYHIKLLLYYQNQ